MLFYLPSMEMLQACADCLVETLEHTVPRSEEQGGQMHTVVRAWSCFSVVIGGVVVYCELSLRQLGPASSSTWSIGGGARNPK
jgi:hypothetical protein